MVTPIPLPGDVTREETELETNLLCNGDGENDGIAGEGEADE